MMVWFIHIGKLNHANTSNPGIFIGYSIYQYIYPMILFYFSRITIPMDFDDMPRGDSDVYLDDGDIGGMRLSHPCL